jgi:hypothetical protein
MAGEDQEASTGWNGEAWMSSDDTAANLVELNEVRSFSVKDGELERVPTTTLKTPNRRPTSTPGLMGDGEAQITLNTRRGSDTYIAIKAAKAAGDDRFFRFNYPELGELVWTDDVIGYVSDIDEGTVDPESNMEMTVTIALNDVVSSAAYAAPGG